MRYLTNNEAWDKVTMKKFNHYLLIVLTELKEWAKAVHAVKR